MAKPIMARATAVWLVDNTTLSFKQIADFVEMHELEVQGIADGDVAQGVKGFDPIANNQLTEEEIEKGQANPLHKLKLKFKIQLVVGKEKGRQTTPEEARGTNGEQTSRWRRFSAKSQPSKQAQDGPGVVLVGRQWLGIF